MRAVWGGGTQSILKREAARYYKTHVKLNSALGELDHPNPTSKTFRQLCTDSVSHRVRLSPAPPHQRTTLIAPLAHATPPCTLYPIPTVIGVAYPVSHQHNARAAGDLYMYWL